MRGTNTIGRRTLNPNNCFLPSSSFSSSSSSSSGGGRGRGGSSPTFNFTRTQPETPQHDASQSQQPPLSHGHGRGRGVPPPSNPNIPSFTSFLNAVRGPEEKPGPGIGRGRGGIVSDFAPQPRVQFTPPPTSPQKQPVLPSDVFPGLNGAGRGKVVGATETMPGSKEENRHLRAKPMQPPRRVVGPPGETMRVGGEAGPVRQQASISQEEAVRKARSVLSRDDGVVRQREGIGRGRGRGMGRGRGRGRRGESEREWGGRSGGRKINNAAEDVVEGLGLGGDPADAEKFANKMGLEVMNQLEEGLEEICERMLPDPVMDDFIDALDANCSIEFEPEYLMGEFGKNPDIDEKPPMPIRDMLEKVKPFLMAYEGIQSQQEWEEAVEDVMKNVPLLKEIVDYYSGPDKVSAKKQQEELERISKTVPASAPPSVKHFTDRAVLCLQSNPGWKYDKKRQFMGKLMQEFSQQYK